MLTLVCHKFLSITTLILPEALFSIPIFFFSFSLFSYLLIDGGAFHISLPVQPSANVRKLHAKRFYLTLSQREVKAENLKITPDSKVIISTGVCCSLKAPCPFLAASRFGVYDVIPALAFRLLFPNPAFKTCH